MLIARKRYKKKEPGESLRTIFRVTLKKCWPVVLNVYNRIRYGPLAPKYGEMIWVNPQEVSVRISREDIKKISGLTRIKKMFGIDDTVILAGRVIESAWEYEKATPIYDVPKIKACIEHWVNGVTWKDTCIYELVWEKVKQKGCHDQCENFEDIITRYENLDTIFEKTKDEGKFNDSDYGSMGIGYIHLGPGGEPFFGGGAYHRFAIAYILNIPFPTRLGLVHVSAIPYLDSYRKEIAES